MQATEGICIPCDDTNSDDESCIYDSDDGNEDATGDKIENLMLSNLEHMRRHVLETKEMRGLVNENTKLDKDTYHFHVRQRFITLVYDHAQNLTAPHPGDE